LFSLLIIFSTTFFELRGRVNIKYAVGWFRRKWKISDISLS